MSDTLTIEQCRRQIHKRTVMEAGLTVPYRQEPSVQIRKFKRAKRPDSSAKLITDEHDTNLQNVRSMLEQLPARDVLKSLLFLPEAAETARSSLDFLCKQRPYELVYEEKALETLVEGLESKPEYIRARATHCLSILAANHADYRDRILEQKGLRSAFQEIIQCPSDPFLVVSCVEFIISCLDHQAMPSIDITIEWTTFLSYLVLNVDFDYPIQRAVVAMAVRALGLVSNYGSVLFPFPDAVVERLVVFLGESDSELVEQALMTLGSAVATSTNTAHVALDAGVLDHMKRLLQQPKLQMGACVLLSNLAAATPALHHMLFLPSIRTMFRQLAALVTGSQPYQLKVKALDVIVKAFNHATDVQIFLLKEKDCVAVLVKALELTFDVALLVNVLQILTTVIESGDRTELDYRRDIITPEAQGQLQALVHHSNRLVSNMSSFLLDHYFSSDEPFENFVPRNHAPNKRQAREPAPGRVSTFGTVQLMNS